MRNDEQTFRLHLLNELDCTLESATVYGQKGVAALLAEWAEILMPGDKIVVDA